MSSSGGCRGKYEQFTIVDFNYNQYTVVSYDTPYKCTSTKYYEALLVCSVAIILHTKLRGCFHFWFDLFSFVLTTKAWILYFDMCNVRRGCSLAYLRAVSPTLPTPIITHRNDSENYQQGGCVSTFY